MAAMSVYAVFDSSSKYPGDNQTAIPAECWMNIPVMLKRMSTPVMLKGTKYRLQDHMSFYSFSVL